MFADTDEVGRLAPIEVVMLPEALAFEAEPQHLNKDNLFPTAEQIGGGEPVFELLYRFASKNPII